MKRAPRLSLCAKTRPHVSFFIFLPYFFFDASFSSNSAPRKAETRFGGRRTSTRNTANLSMVFLLYSLTSNSFSLCKNIVKRAHIPVERIEKAFNNSPDAALTPLTRTSGANTPGKREALAAATSGRAHPSPRAPALVSPSAGKKKALSSAPKMSLNMPKTPEKQSAAALGAPKLDWDLERYSLFDRLKAAAHELDLDISFPVEDPPPPDPAILRRKIRQLLSRHHAPPAILTTTADGETVAPLLDSPRPEEEADAGPPSPEPVYAHDSLSPPRLKDVQFNLSPDDLVDLYAKVSQSETLLTDYSAVLRFIVLVHLSRTASALCVDDLLNPGWNAELLWVQSTMDSLQHCDGLRDFHQAVMATYEEKEEARLAAGEFDYERVSRKRWTEMRDFIHVFGEVLEGKCRSALFEEVDRVKLHFRALCDMDPRKDAQDEEWLVQYAWPAPGLRSYCETFGWKHHDDEDLLYKEYEDEHEEEEEEEDEEDDDWDQYEAAPMSTPRKYALHSPPPLDFDDGSSSSDNPERPLDVSRHLAWKVADAL